MFTTSYGFIYYITQRIVLRISEYKPLGIKENEQKAKMISNLLGNSIFSNLLDPSPQAARSVARAIFNFFFICRPVDSFTRILHLSDYPQGRDRFTLPSVCKLYVDANSIRVMPRIGYGFLCKQYIYKSSKSPFNTGSSGIPDSRSPIFLYNYLKGPSLVLVIE